jgi:hypothetical protein
MLKCIEGQKRVLERHSKQAGLFGAVRESDHKCLESLLVLSRVLTFVRMDTIFFFFTFFIVVLGGDIMAFIKVLTYYTWIHPLHCSPLSLSPPWTQSYFIFTATLWILLIQVITLLFYRKEVRFTSSSVCLTSHSARTCTSVFSCWFCTFPLLFSKVEE